MSAQMLTRSAQLRGAPLRACGAARRGAAAARAAPLRVCAAVKVGDEARASRAHTLPQCLLLHSDAARRRVCCGAPRCLRRHAKRQPRKSAHVWCCAPR
jgi:hypothetical protein